MARIGIAGFGFMGGVHAQAWRAVPGVRVVAVASGRPEVARAKAAKLGLAVEVHADLDSLLRHAGVDIVDVCLPTNLHVAAVEAAAGAGRHVLCEKPAALSLAEVDRMAAVVRSAGVVARVAHCLRFWPEYRALEAVVRRGTLGALRALTLVRRAARPRHGLGDWLADEARSGSAAVDLHIHDTDFLVHLLGEPAAVASTVVRGETGAERIHTLYRYPGVAVQAEGAWDLPSGHGFRMAFDAVFEGGVVAFDSVRAPTLWAAVGKEALAPLPFASPAVGPSVSGEGNLSELGGYVSTLEAFAAGVAGTGGDGLPTLVGARVSLRVVLAELESARRGDVVRLAEFEPCPGFRA